MPPSAAEGPHRSAAGIRDRGSVLVAAVNQAGNTLSDDSSLHTLSTADGSVIQSWSYPRSGTTGLSGSRSRREAA